ncbi:MAG: hypothetical protein JSV79_09140 [Armatimonadota bacterium]|nr:MAG: hypothetical protein JSV79_09140 [Armatimonadota bacterium]
MDLQDTPRRHARNPDHGPEYGRGGSEPARRNAAPRPITPRAFILGAILVILVSIAVEYGELVEQVGELVGSSLMLIVTFLLCLFLAANYLLKRRRSRRRFSRAELLYLFVMLTAAGNIAGVGMMQLLIPLLGHLFHFATPTNRWEQFQPYVPLWLVPDTSVLPGYYDGGTTFFTADHIAGWLHPFLTWSVFMFAFVAFTLCLSLLLRRQWIEKERLSFPIVYFPIELTREGTSIWRDRLLWIGFVIPVVLQSLASLNYLYPSVPYLPLKPTPALNIGRLLAKGPTDPLAEVTLAFYPMALGIAYFAQLEVLFSCWFFYWVARLEVITSTALGFGGPMSQSDMPYLNQQSLGAFVALGAVALWLGRGEIALAFKRALRIGRTAKDQSAPSTGALVGLIIAGLFLLYFGLTIGIPLHILALFFTIYFLVVIGFSRIRAIAGLPWLFGPNHPPHIFMTWAVGSRNISTQALTSLNYLQWFDWDYRGTAMPHQMEALKISHSAGLKNRDIAKSILIAVAIAIVVSFIAILAICYHFGAESGKVESYRINWAGMPINLLVTWAETQSGIGWDEIAGGAVGAGVVCFLSLAHTRLAWWPFHPVGYALSCTFTPQWLWCPLFVVWLTKLLILRYGGIRLYRRGIPLAVGLILGDYVIAILWGIIGLIAGQQMHSIFWT